MFQPGPDLDPDAAAAAAASPSTSNYTQGYSKATTTSHASRTVHSDAAFLIPHVAPTDTILDVGCGPGTITTGLGSLVPQGSVVGIDISDDVLAQARETLEQQRQTQGHRQPQSQSQPQSQPQYGPGAPNNVTFQKADLLAGLPFPDDHFDIVFCSQLFPHIPGTETKLECLAEMRRVLKPGGTMATRDAAELHFYPRAYDLDRLWVGNMVRGFGFGRAGGGGGAQRDDEVLAGAWLPGGEMPAVYRKVGFEPAKVRVGAGTTVHAGAEARRWFADGCMGRLSPGDAFRESWTRVGISDGDIEETRGALETWAEDEDAWYIALQAEIVATK